MRAAIMRAEIEKLINAVPFRPFVVSLDSGERALIGHPENIAFEPGLRGSLDFYVITGSVRMFSTFDKLSAVSLLQHADDHPALEQQVG